MDRLARHAGSHHAPPATRQPGRRGRGHGWWERRRPNVSLVCAVLLGLVACAPAPEALYREGRDQFRRGDLTQALLIANRGYSRYGADSHSAPYWQFRLFLAEVLLAQGKPKEALPYLEGEIPPGARFREFTARRLLHKGYAALIAGNDRDASRFLEEASHLAGAAGFTALAAEIEMRRGGVLARTEDSAGAEARFRAASDLASQARDPYLEACALGNLGYNLLKSSRFDEAVPWFEKSLVLSQKAGARMLEAHTFGNLGRCYHGLGDYDRSVELLSKAEVLSGQLGSKLARELWLGDLADSYYARNEFPKAVRYYLSALALSREVGEAFDTAATLCNLATAYVDSGDVASAARYNQQAAEILAKINAPALVTLSRLIDAHIALANKDFPAAESGFRQVLARTSDLEDRMNRWDAQHGLARLFAEQSRTREADAAFRDALSTLEQARSQMPRDEWKLSFHSASMRVYQNYIDFLMAGGRSASALEIAEFARARVLAQKLGAVQSLEKPLSAAHFRAFAREHRAALISFWLAPQRSFVWIVTGDRIEIAELPPAKELSDLVAGWQASIRDLRDPLETANPAASRLSKILLDPVRKGIGNRTRLIVAPDGALHEINLEALPVFSPKPHYWLEDVDLAVAPSLALLRGAAQPDHRPRSLLLIGNSLPPGKDYPALPQVDRELANVRARLSGWAQTVFTGSAALPTVYRESDPGRFSVIHFSAHAETNPLDPLSSAVILSPSAGGFKLYAREIAAIPLHSQLVTVSACRGAGSRVYSGEGLVGFAWAFLRAGAEDVVAGLWEVNDASTAALMDVLYSRLAEGSRPAEALRAAKLELLHSSSAWRKPYYWAAFETLSRVGP